MGAHGLKQNGTALADDGTLDRAFVYLDHLSVVYHTQSSRFDSVNFIENKQKIAVCPNPQNKASI